MAGSIRDVILKEYEIDIDEIDLLKLYKITDPKTAWENVDQMIEETHQRFLKQSNSTMDEMAKRGRENLEKEEKYKKILKKKGNIEKLYRYKNQEAKEENKDKLTAAREYFSVIRESKKIQAKDITFFYDYFYDQRKYRNEINELLVKEFGVPKTETERAGKKDGAETEEAGEQKKEGLYVNFCDRQTLIWLKRAADGVKAAPWSDKVKEKCAETSKTNLEEFLNFSKWKDVQAFQQYIDGKRLEIDEYTKDSHEFDPLLDIYNTMSRVAAARDFQQNFSVYGTILRYQELTPYMFGIEEMTKKALSALWKTAQNCQYNFRDSTDLLTTYLLPVYQNFGIDIHGIRNEMKKLENEKYRRKILGALDKITGRGKDTYLPIWQNILFIVCYLPFLLLLVVFEAVKFVAYKIRYLAFVAAPVVIFDLLFFFWTWIAYAHPIHLFSQAGRAVFFRVITGIKTDFGYAVFMIGDQLLGVTVKYGLTAIIAAGVVIFAIEVFAAVIPGILVGVSMWNAAAGIQKDFDWIGCERTLMGIHDQLKRKFKTRKIWKAFIPPIFYIALYIGLIAGFQRLPHMADSFAKPDYASWVKARETGETSMESEAETDTPETEEITYTILRISADAANVRAGAGTNYKVLTVAQRGEEYEATGNSETPNGKSVWYEIFLDESRTATGWVSEKVIE